MSPWEIAKSALLYKFRYYLIIGVLIAGILAVLSAIIASIVGDDGLGSNVGTIGTVICTPTGQVDDEKAEDVFAKAGVFTGKKQAFLDAADKAGIDPILFIAIVMNETGWGTSKAVREKNNPGGVMMPGGGLRIFSSIEEGIDYTASNLYRNYIAKNIVTIPEIGAKYAPIGASNDPTGMNLSWVPTVTAISVKLGGLTQNCSSDLAVGTGEFTSPVGGSLEITSGFGYRTHPVTGEKGSFHKGVDFRCSVGDPIYAADSGSVVVAVTAGSGGGYGHHIIIDHGGKSTLYGHLTTLLVNLKQSVKKGEQIGTCGRTGRVTGPHLHFEVQTGSLYGVRQDPMPFFESKKDDNSDSDE